MSSVDVIVPCYRNAHFLRQCAESLLTQPDGDVRILIFDDARRATTRGKDTKIKIENY